MHATTADRTHRVEIRLLGGFELCVDGCIIDVQPGMRRLAAFVALAPRGVDRMFAAFQLWPNSSERRAQANLRSALWRLRKVDAEVVHATTSRLRLEDSVWLDTRDGLSNASERLLPYHLLEPDLLPDWYDDWLMVERERHRQLQLRQLEQRAQSALDSGDPSNAVQWSLAALAVDGRRDSAHRILVDAHRAEGNLHEVDRETARYERCLDETQASMAV